MTNKFQPTLKAAYAKMIILIHQENMVDNKQ